MDFQRCAFNWPVLRKLSTEFSLRVKTFLVFGMGDDVLIQTNDEDITYGFGGNRFGLLGLGHSNAVMEQPEEIAELTGKGVIDLRNGINHVLALTRNGELMAWGGNKVGQLGDGTTEDLALPKLIEHTERFAMVRCGSFHNVALTRNGRVYCWGSNEAGQCGQGNMERQLRPALVEALMDLVVVAIDCGSHVLALTDQGDVYGWSDNLDGQLGIGNLVKQTTPVKVVIRDSPIKMIACSENYSMVLSQEGTAYGFGCNWNGEVGSGSTEYQLTKPEPVQCELPFEFIALYGHLSIGLSRTGLCYIWGEVKNEDVLVPRLTEMTSILEAMSDYTMLTYTPHPIQVKYKFQRAIPVSISIASSFDQKELSDLKVTIGGKSILVHRSILRITSCYFRKMLSEVWSRTDEIKIDSYSFPVYYAYLRFLYTDTLLIDRDCAQELLDLSVSFMEHDLQIACLTLLVSNLSIENCCHLYKLSAHYQFQAQFHRTILDFIACNIRLVQQTDTFKSFEPEQAEQLSNELEL